MNKQVCELCEGAEIWEGEPCDCVGEFPVDPCECDNEDSKFFQDHGCCMYCYFVGGVE